MTIRPDAASTHQELQDLTTPAGCAAPQAELLQLRQDVRPKVVEIVSWAASNGDRSENADYHYGKKRLREDPPAYTLIRASGSKAPSWSIPSSRRA